jgi:hypothetical protein
MLMFVLVSHCTLTLLHYHWLHAGASDCSQVQLGQCSALVTSIRFLCLTIQKYAAETTRRPACSLASHICSSQRWFGVQRDAQVLDRMLVLMEDWARSLPQPQFAAAHTSAMKAGVQGPQRAEHQKAPLLDGMRYDLQRREQLAVQQMWRQQERLGRDRIPEYDRLSPTPPAPPVHPQV